MGEPAGPAVGERPPEASAPGLPVAERQVSAPDRQAAGLLRVAFIGDIVGAPGRRVLQQQLPALRERFTPDVVIANAENVRAGSGITPELYDALRAAGIDAITLGDHCYRDRRVLGILERPEEPIARPANLADGAPGRRVIRVPLPRHPGEGGAARSLFIITVLGRIYFPLPANDPFATVDALLAALPERRPIVIVEAHMEATSEKAALAHHLDGRVAAVLGTHTHVPTADARILRGGTAFITDVGMCGPYDTIIGRDAANVLRHMTTGVHVPYELGEGGEALCGAVLEIDPGSGLARSIERVELRADRRAAPFR